jgi:hypothetical protein
LVSLATALRTSTFGQQKVKTATLTWRLRFSITKVSQYEKGLFMGMGTWRVRNTRFGNDNVNVAAPSTDLELVDQARR